MSISLKDAKYNWLGRSYTLPYYTDTAADIYAAARQLLQRYWLPGRPVRLMGVSLAGLVPACTPGRPFWPGGKAGLRLLLPKDLASGSSHLHAAKIWYNSTQKKVIPCRIITGNPGLPTTPTTRVTGSSWPTKGCSWNS
ncbi:hypothetical protein SDD30_02390, partial [Moorella naiadis]|uniref:DinB/UmuC family translesion DNA polymerase n=1 Tax=Moorella naiadis (nom. illeg.) TaxID=3093670 RepID=UPI003F03BB03